MCCKIRCDKKSLKKVGFFEWTKQCHNLWIWVHARQLGFDQELLMLPAHEEVDGKGSTSRGAFEFVSSIDRCYLQRISIDLDRWIPTRRD